MLTPTEEQLAIIEAATKTKDNLIISALAGAAKTSTLVMVAEAVKSPMLCLAFNRRIADEMRQRLPSHCEAMTLNSLGHRVWGRSIGRRLVVNTRKNYEILTSLIDDLSRSDKEAAYSNFTEILRAIELGKTCGYVPSGRFPNAKRLMDDDEFFAHLEEEPTSLEEDLIRRATFASIDMAFKGTIDFSDQILMPTVFPASFPQYPLVLIDEAQDLSALNHATLRKLAKKRLIAVGDECQCNPSGTMIDTIQGKIPIENIKVGDEVIVPHRDKPYLRSRKVEAVASRHYKGRLIIIGDGQNSYAATPNHRCLVRLRSDRANWTALYLMRKGRQFRVGTAVLMRKGTNGLAMRARQERADAMWLVGVYPDKRLALAEEAVVAAMFGLPDFCFHNSGELAIDQTSLNAMWRRIGDNSDRAQLLLDHCNLLMQYPIWQKGSKEELSMRSCLVRACNLLPDLFEVTTDGRTWRAADIDETSYDGMVHSLEIEKSPSTNNRGLYLANNIATGNSIYGFRGAHEDSMRVLEQSFSMRKLILSISFRCPQAVVREAQWRAPHMRWPEWAEEGEVRTLSSWSASDLPETATILCRNNAPIFSIALALLRNGRYPQIVGNDIGRSLIKILKKFGPTSMRQEEVFAAIELWAKEKKRKSRNKGRVDDQAECLRIFAEQGANLGDAIAYAEHILAAHGPIQLMTIHKSKGLEWDDVFILDEHLIRDDQQDMNLRYVAQTRAKRSLTYISSDGFVDGDR